MQRTIIRNWRTSRLKLHTSAEQMQRLKFKWWRGRQDKNYA